MYTCGKVLRRPAVTQYVKLSAIVIGTGNTIEINDDFHVIK